MTSLPAKPTARAITATVIAAAIGLPLLTILLARTLIGDSWKGPALVVPLGVADAFVLAGFGVVAFFDYSAALEHRRQPRLTLVSLGIASLIACGIMLAGGVALEQGVHAGGPGSSTNGVAVFFIPLYSAIAGTLGYAVVWIAGSVLAPIVRRARSAERFGG